MAKASGKIILLEKVPGITKVLMKRWTPDPRGVLRISRDGDDRMGAKIKTQENP